MKFYKKLIFVILSIISLFISCSGNNQDVNVDKIVFFDKNIKCEISTEAGFLNYNISYKDENLLNTKMKIDSFQMRKYKNFIISVSSNISKTPTNIYLSGEKEIYYLTNNELLKEAFLNFDNAILLKEKLKKEVLEKVNTLVVNKDYDKAFKVAEMSVFMRQPFYYGVSKDDINLKIMAQKDLFEQGQKEEAINNLLKL